MARDPGIDAARSEPRLRTLRAGTPSPITTEHVPPRIRITALEYLVVAMLAQANTLRGAGRYNADSADGHRD